MAATVFAANESSVTISRGDKGSETIDGVRSLEYRHVQARSNVYALGSAERVAMVSGARAVEGVLHIASTSETLNGIGDETFQIIVHLKHDKSAMSVAFDDCFLQSKSFGMGVGEHGEATYGFSAIRVTETHEEVK